MGLHLEKVARLWSEGSQARRLRPQLVKLGMGHEDCLEIYEKLQALSQRYALFNLIESIERIAYYQFI